MDKNESIGGGVNFIFPVKREDEQAFLSCCARAYFATGCPKDFFYNRARSSGATGISVHFDDATHASRFIAAIDANEQGVEIASAALPVISDENRQIGDVFGGIDNATLYRDFSVRTSPILMDWILQCEGSQAKIRAIATEVLISYLYLAHVTLPALRGERAKTNYPNAFVSYRSHFEAFASTCENPSSVRAQFDSRYATIAPHLNSMLDRYSEGGLDGVAPKWLAEWLLLLKERFEWTYQAVQQDRLVGAGGSDTNSDRNLLASAFHRKMFDSKEFLKHGMRDPVFQCNRILLGLTYLTLFRLGLPMIERYFLCYAVSRSVSEKFDITAERAFADGLWRSRARRLLNVVRAN